MAERAAVLASHVDRVALVTGAGSGIGRAACLKFAEEGYSVVCVDVREAAARAVAETLRQRGGVAEAVAADVSREEDVERMVARAVDRFGRIDLCFNNAGIIGDRACTDSYSTAQFERVLAVNLQGVFLCMKHELRAMTRQRPVGRHGVRGVIVNTSSTAGLKGMSEFGAYCASKWGILGLTRSAAAEYASRGIRVNAVCPATTDTAMVDYFKERWPEWQEQTNQLYKVGRICTAEEVAEAVLWLGSDKSPFVVGDPIVLGGGSTC
eukprot:TRINITY_DN45016_c0_g1_i1.p1 TRINITY_DN45016_c0_g1~~TRINITY_DN45016_c0_g1_i1.p1  ORF type:complete len:282 (+),score=91.12 TRINITY_DN45016_c0_g1_i1:49-846(+)